MRIGRDKVIQVDSATVLSHRLETGKVLANEPAKNEEESKELVDDNTAVDETELTEGNPPATDDVNPPADGEVELPTDGGVEPPTTDDVNPPADGDDANDGTEEGTEGGEGTPDETKKPKSGRGRKPKNAND